MKRRNGNENQSESSSLSSAKGMQESSEPCEICGSVGIAGLIMKCFKCKETREHTYCARVLLPSVPPIWLCEVCRFSGRILLRSDAAKDLMDSETSVAEEPKNSDNSREENQETAKLRTIDMEEPVEAGVSLPVILQASTRDSSYEISANVSPVIHPPSQPHTSLVAKDASPVFNDTSQGKEASSTISGLS